MSVCLNGHFYGYFNPRSRGGSDKMIIVNIPYDFYFNPRSRGGSDGQGTKHCLLQQHISIHAPAEGATCHDYNKGPLRFSISIHAPAEGATQFMKQTGGDIGISIHAPAEGATQEGGETPPEDSDFNPRSRGGSDSKHTQFFRSNFRTKCAYLYFLLHYIFFTQNKQSYK